MKITPAIPVMNQNKQVHENKNRKKLGSYQLKAVHIYIYIYIEKPDNEDKLNR